MSADAWHGLRVGDQIGNLEYVVDDQALARYRLLVGGDGSFPNLMAEDCRAMLERRETGETLTTVWQRLDFLRPPITGRRIQVGGWVRELRQKCGRPWVKAAAFAVDEIGTEILRSEAAFEVGHAYTHPQELVETIQEPSRGRRLASCRAGDSCRLGQLRVRGSDGLTEYRKLSHGLAGFEMPGDGNGLTAVTAGWLEYLLEADFGEDFRWGGRLSIAYHRTVLPGTQLRCDGVVVGHDTNADGVRTWRVVMSVRDADDHRVATADAVVTSPSPRLL